MAQFSNHTEVRVEYAITLEIEGQQSNSDLKGFTVQLHFLKAYVLID